MEGVTQGGLLAMVAYDIGVLYLIKLLKAVNPDVTQTWYSDNDNGLGTFNNIGLYFNSLKQFSPGRGYYPKSSKSVLFVHPDKPAAGKFFVLRHGFIIWVFLLGMMNPNMIG